MNRIHLAGLVLIALSLTAFASFSAAADALTVFGHLSAGLLILALSAFKALVILRRFLGLDRASAGWRVLLYGYVLLLCGTLGAVLAVGPLVNAGA